MNKQGLIRKIVILNCIQCAICVMSVSCKKESIEIQTNEKQGEKVYTPIESVKKLMPEDITNLNVLNFVEDMPLGFYAAGTYISARSEEPDKIYAGPRQDDERYYGEFKSGDIAVIENFYEYSGRNIKTDYVWYQICVLSTGMEGWIKVNKNENKYLYSYKGNTDNNFTISTINADIKITKKTGSIEYNNSGYGDYDSIAFNDGGNEFIVNIDGRLYLYDVGSSVEKAVIMSDENIDIEEHTECAYSKNGKTIYIVNSEGNIYSYSIDKKKLKKLFQFTFDKGSYYYPWKIYVSPDERFIYTQSSVLWNNREDAMAFVYDRKLKKQYVFDIRNSKRPDSVCGEFSNFVFDENSDAYASTFSFGYGGLVFVHFYLDKNDELKYEQFEDDLGTGSSLCYNPEQKAIISAYNMMMTKNNTKGKTLETKYAFFGVPKNIYADNCCISSDGTKAAYFYCSDEGYENIAIYSTSSMNLLGVITDEDGDGIDIQRFEGNTLIVHGKNKKQYTAYVMDINEKEKQFDFSVPYDEKLDELFGKYRQFEFFGESVGEGIPEGPGGVWESMNVSFFPNGFYLITSESCIEDSWINGYAYGTYEVNWPKFTLFSSTSRYNGFDEHEFNESDFHYLNIVTSDFEDTKASFNMEYDYDLAHDPMESPKIKSDFGER